jgi:hypothetical protein
MVFTPGYGHISVFDSLLAPDNQHLKPLTTTYLAKRSAHPRPIGLESQLLNYRVPRPSVVVPVCHLLGFPMISIHRSDIRPRLEELGDATRIPARSCPVQRRETITIRYVWVRAKLEQDLY